MFSRCTESPNTCVVLNERISGFMNSGQIEVQEHTNCIEQSRLARSDHDIRASLAITNGFNQALESSFSELCAAFDQFLLNHEPQTDDEKALMHRVERLEGDCRFCLSRINRSLVQLGTRIEKESVMNSHTQGAGSLDSL